MSRFFIRNKRLGIYSRQYGNKAHVGMVGPDGSVATEVSEDGRGSKPRGPIKDIHIRVAG